MSDAKNNTANTPAIAALQRFVGGELSWRMACSELGLWSYDELYTLLHENGMAPPMPQRDITRQQSVIDLILATAIKDMQN